MTLLVATLSRLRLVELLRRLSDTTTRNRQGVGTKCFTPLASWLRVVVACLCLSLALPPHVRAADSANVPELDARTEAAIGKSLEYLARSQNADGSFGKGYQSASTALALMAFMLQGHFPEGEQYSQNMTKGVDFLIARLKSNNGYAGGNMYEHGLATLALSEVWGMSSDPGIRDTLKKAVNIILRAQSSSGGWRYEPRPKDADLSCTIMQVVALASAKEAGIMVPDKTIEKAIKYVQGNQCTDGGFGYTAANGSGFGRSGAGALALMLCGQREAPEVKRGLAYLRTPAVAEGALKQTEYYLYAHYYVMQAMYQAEESHYQEWYPKIRDALLARQGGDGSWNDSGGQVVATGMAVLVLGVPYRYLPIYQR